MLALCIVLTMLPMGVLATGEVPETSEPTTIESETEEPQTQEDVPTDNVPAPIVEPEETVEPVPLAEDAPTSGTCGENAFWTLDEDGTLTISGTGAMDDFINPNVSDTDSSLGFGFTVIEDSPWRNIKTVIINEGITRIGAGSFHDEENLVNLIIPNSVTSIGMGAFCDCSGLTKITLPNSLSSIEAGAFCDCTNLTDLIIPNSVTNIGVYAFKGCSNLTNIPIPKKVTYIGSGAFSSCTRLTNISILGDISEIRNSTFSECYNLTTVTIPKSVLTIHPAAFGYSDALTTVYYTGSKSDWENINRDLYGEYYTFWSKLPYATIHYNSSNPDDNDKPKPPSIDDDNEPPISTDVLTFKDVHYYDTIAKTDVSVDLTWNWNDLLLRDSYVYKVNLAKMGLALSAAIEGTNFKEETNNILIGTDKENRLMLNEVAYDEDITPAMAVGIKQIKNGGETKNVIFVVLRGTTNIMDVGNDLFSSYGATQWGVNIVNYRLHSYLERWSDKYDINKNNTKFFVTGHSLGGACANLLSAELSKECGEENVFGYTFAVPSPLNKMEDISRFRGNIYNFLCLQDNVPSHFSLRDTWYGYGYPRWFNIRELSKTENTYKKLTGKYWISTYYEHSMVRLHAPSAYMAYLMADPTLNDSVVKYNYVRIKCPVDVEVYNSNNELVGRIANDEIDYDHYAPTVKLIICDGAKYVYFLDDDTYTVKITGTGDGTMTYMAASRNINSNTDEKSKIYSNVKIDPGKKFRSIVSAHDETNTDNLVEIPDVELLVTDDNGNAVAQVLPDIEASLLGKDNGTEIPIKNNDEPTPDTKPGGVVPDGQPGTNTKPGENTPGTIPDNEPGNNNSGVSADFDSTNTDSVSGKGNTKQNSAKSASPKTGDNTPIILYVWFIMISGLAVLFWCVISRRKNNDSI